MASRRAALAPSARQLRSSLARCLVARRDENAATACQRTQLLVRQTTDDCACHRAPPSKGRAGPRAPASAACCRSPVPRSRACWHRHSWLSLLHYRQLPIMPLHALLYRAEHAHHLLQHRLRAGRAHLVVRLALLRACGTAENYCLSPRHIESLIVHHVPACRWRCSPVWVDGRQRGSDV